MNNLPLLLICASLVTHSCNTMRESKELDNPITHSEMSESIFSERLGRPAKNNWMKEVQPSSAPSESIYYEKVEKPESETVHLLIHDDFKKFLKTMPVMTLRKLKNLTISDPEAGHRYLLQLAKEVSGKLNDPKRDKLRAGLKDCSTQDPKCYASRFTKLIPIGEAQESQNAHSKDSITDGQYNTQVASGGVGYEFEDSTDPALLALAPGRNKMRKFQLRIKNNKPSSTLFSDSSLASDPLRPSAFSADRLNLQYNRFPFTPSPKDEGALADIITFGSADFQDPIPLDRFQHFSQNSEMLYPQSQGAMGPYSWTIEPASFDKVQSETFLPPTAIYQAISQAEQMDIKEQQQYFKHDPLRFHKDFKPYRKEAAAEYSKFRKRIPETRPNKAYQSRPDSVQKYYPGYDIKSAANTLGIPPPGPNYAQAFAPPAGQFIPDPGAFFGNGGGAGDYTPGYLPGSGFVEEGSYGSNGNYLGQLMDQAKSYFGFIAKVTGAYNNQAMTRKILEVSIGILGFLAFGGYIAVLLFRPFIPDYLKFPYFPGTVNTTTVQNNGGLLGYFLGRSLKESDRVFILEHSFMDKLEEVVKVAVAEGNRKNMKSRDNEDE